jgi:hypothetical protein
MPKATQAQYDAAGKAIHNLANQMIEKLNWFAQAPARNALNDTVVKQFAVAAVDAAMNAAPAVMGSSTVPTSGGLHV